MSCIVKLVMKKPENGKDNNPYKGDKNARRYQRILVFCRILFLVPLEAKNNTIH
jgi:hypothetical protein